MNEVGIVAVDDLRLTADVYCLPPAPGADDSLLPEGTLIRDLWRGEHHGELGVAWRLQASTDGGITWSAYETMWNDEEPFPVTITVESPIA